VRIYCQPIGWSGLPDGSEVGLDSLTDCELDVIPVRNKKKLFISVIITC